MTQVKTVDKIEQEKIEALAKHLDCSIDEAINSMEDYTVYTDQEADEAVYNYIKESVCFFRSDFIAAHAEVEEDVIKKLERTGIMTKLRDLPAINLSEDLMDLKGALKP